MCLTQLSASVIPRTENHCIQVAIYHLVSFCGSSTLGRKINEQLPPGCFTCFDQRGKLWSGHDLPTLPRPSSLRSSGLVENKREGLTLYKQTPPWPSVISRLSVSHPNLISLRRTLVEQVAQPLSNPAHFTWSHIEAVLTFVPCTPQSVSAAISWVWGSCGEEGQDGGKILCLLGRNKLFLQQLLLHPSR